MLVLYYPFRHVPAAVVRRFQIVGVYVNKIDPLVVLILVKSSRVVVISFSSRKAAVVWLLFSPLLTPAEPLACCWTVRSAHEGEYGRIFVVTEGG